MKTVFYGRIVFGASAVLFGVITLMWHDPATWQNLHQIWRLPFGTIIGRCLMTALIAGGIGMQFPRSAAVILGVVYLCFSLACIPGIIAATNIYERYGGSFFLFFSLLCGAIALFAATEANAARALVFGRLARMDSGSVRFHLRWVKFSYLGSRKSPLPRCHRCARSARPRTH
ncbi:MAG: hypothetical protein WCB11_00740 [Terriglobales bacterium]|jgi:hypothetical protein